MCGCYNKNMSRKHVPYLFLILLTIILFFIIGVRYGQKVEKANKTIDLLVSIAPTTTTAPTSRPLAFKTYARSACGIRFLYPSTLEIDREGTNGAMLREKEAVKLSFDCDPKNKTVVQATDGARMTFQKQSVTATLKNDMYFMSVRHPLSGRIILISVDKTYYPLLEKSIEFTSN